MSQSTTSSSRVTVQVWAIAAVLAVVNIFGLVWIRRNDTGHPLDRPLIKVVAALPSQDVDQTDRFSLVFEQPVADLSMVGKALDRPLFLIDPQPPGHWQWAEAKRLDYVLDKPLPPGRMYTIHPAVNLETLTGRTLVGPTSFKFATKRLRVEDVRLLSVDREQAIIEIKFNQPVEPGELLRRIMIRDGNSSSRIEPLALTHTPADAIQLRIRHYDGIPAILTVSRELKGFGADATLGEDFTKSIPIPATFRLIGAEVRDDGLGGNLSVALNFTGVLDRKQSVPELKFDPPVAAAVVQRAYSQLMVSGPFKGGMRYTVTVPADLLSADGKTLGSEQATSFNVPLPEPKLRFTHAKGILTPGGNLKLDLDAVNVTGIQLQATRVYPNNLISAIQGLEPVYTSKDVLSKTFTLDGVPNVSKKYALDLRGLLQSPKGIYSVLANATDRNWTATRATVAITDLALTAKRFPHGTIVWVTSLASGKPVGGVKVAAISRTNQVLAQALSGPDGVARLENRESDLNYQPPQEAVSDGVGDYDGEEGDGDYGYRRGYRYRGGDDSTSTFYSRYLPPEHPEDRPWVLLAQLDDDQSYLLPDQRKWKLEDVDQSGRDIPRNYDVFLYAERGAYRPGDPVHLTGIVRDGDGRTPPAFPLTVVVSRPDGRDVAEIAVSPDPALQGIFHAEYDTSPGAPTGVYGFRATLPGGKNVLGSTEAKIEAFLPVRMEVKAGPRQRVYLASEPAIVTVDARYLFGQPGSELPLTVTGEFQRVPLHSTKYPEYTFGDLGKTRAITLTTLSLNLDKEGHADATIPAPSDADPGLWFGKMSATVTENGGKSVSGNFSVYVDTVGRHLGLKLNADHVALVGDPVRVDWAQRTGDDRAAEPAPMDVQLVRIEYDSMVEYVNGRRSWKSAVSEIEAWKQTITPPAGAEPAGSFEVTCPIAGQYKLRATDPSTKAVTELNFYASPGSGDGGAAPVGANDKVAMNKPERLEIVLDKASYQPGETAKALIRSPIPGALFMTIETDRVVDHRVFEMKENTVQIEVPIHPNLVYGAFLAATVVRRVDPADKEWLPHRAMGLVRLPIDPKPLRMPVTIEAPAKAYPEGKIQVTVQTAPPLDPARPSVVHLWAVDEGIMLTTGFRTPDPFARFYEPRRAVVASSDVFGDLMPDAARPADISVIGGDGAAEGLYLNPSAAKKRKPAVVWRGAMIVGPDGRATVEIEVPPITGELRLMAVAVDQSRYGSGQRKVTVAAPIMIETSFPRFAAPGDAFEVPVKIFNTTDKPTSATLTLAAEGPIEILTPINASGYMVAAGQQRLLWLSARAKQDVGEVSVRVEGRATGTEGAYVAHSEDSFFVRPPGPIDSEVAVTRLEVGKEMTFAQPEGFFPESLRSTLTFSGQPRVQLLPALEQLIDYPYGCVEQTTSRLLGMLYAPDLLTQEGLQKGRAATVKELIEVGITRLWSMQTPAGGLAYWPGGVEPNLWGTTYAAGFLLQAKRQGYEINARFTGDLVAYLESLMRNRGGEAEADLDPNTRAFICRVLAGFERPQPGWMATLTERAADLDVAGRAHLAGAWLEVGRKDQARAVLKDDTLGMNIKSTMSGRLTSQASEEAALLDVLLDLDKDHTWIPGLVDRLNAARKNGGYWMNTHENATALAALARYQSLHPEATKFKGWVTGPGGERKEFGDAAPLSLAFKGKIDPIQLNSEGQGFIYATVAHKGVRREPAKEGYDRHLEVRRTWTTADGKPVDAQALKVGDMINVEVSIKAPGLGSGAIDNVAIVDLLAGAMEVENPRLATSAQTAEEGRDRPDRVEFLDDRVALFCSARYSARRFRYALRVSQAGTFTLPPLQADAMYDPSYASINGGGTVTVLKEGAGGKAK